MKHPLSNLGPARFLNFAKTDIKLLPDHQNPGCLDQLMVPRRSSFGRFTLLNYYQIIITERDRVRPVVQTPVNNLGTSSSDVEARWKDVTICQLVRRYVDTVTPSSPPPPPPPCSTFALSRYLSTFSLYFLCKVSAVSIAIV